MTPEQIEEARRWVALPGWRWMAGMLTLEEIVPPAITLGWDAARVLHADEGEPVRVCTVLGKIRDIHDTALPDLTDPATVGCLLALAREITGRADLTASPAGRDWWGIWLTRRDWGGPLDATAHTETLALLAACEQHERVAAALRIIEEACEALDGGETAPVGLAEGIALLAGRYIGAVAEIKQLRAQIAARAEVTP